MLKNYLWFLCVYYALKQSYDVIENVMEAQNFGANLVLIY